MNERLRIARALALGIVVATATVAVHGAEPQQAPATMHGDAAAASTDATPSDAADVRTDATSSDAADARTDATPSVAADPSPHAAGDADTPANTAEAAPATGSEAPAGPRAAPASGDQPNAIDAMVPSSPTGAPPGDPSSAGVIAADLGARLTAAAHQIQTHEYADAEPALTTIISELEQQTSRYDPVLVTPLTLLGDSQSGQEKYKEALRSYEQAQHIARVSEGLHTPTQVDLIYREANTLASMGQIDKANDRQEYAYETLMRAYGSFSPSLIPGLYHLAAWYDRTSNIFAARGLYERAIQIVARDGGDRDPGLIPALRGLANTYREERFPPYEPPEQRLPGAPLGAAVVPGPGEAPAIIVNRFGPGEAALIEIIKITQANPQAKPLDLALAEIDLADWYLLFDKPERATPVYVEARQVMRENAGLTDEQINAYFEPTVLYRPIPANPPAPPPGMRTNPTEGFVEIGYTVTADGEVGDLKTLASQPDGLMDMKVRRGMRAARFRPRFDGDIPVAAPNLVYRHTFIYYPHPDATTPDGSKQNASAQ